MKQTITRNGKRGKPMVEKKQNKKFLNMILDGKLKDPPLPVLENISVELGIDVAAGDDH